MGLLTLGVDALALKEVFNKSEIKIRTWLCRCGIYGKKLHERFILELDLIHLHLDDPPRELRAFGSVGQLETLQSRYVIEFREWGE